MPELPRRRALTALLGAGAVACASQAARDDLGPIAVRVFELQLRDSDSLYLSRPSSAVRDGGALFIGDMFQGRIVEFDGTTGIPRRVMGRPGSGPGEFRDVGSVFALGDTIVGAVDLARKTFTLFDRRTGEFLRARSYDGWADMTQPQPGLLAFGDMNLERATAVGIWFFGPDSMAYRIPLPREYRESADLAGMYSGARIAVVADTLLLAMPGLNRLEYYVLDGTWLMGIQLPARDRRGSSPEIIERLKPAPNRTYEQRWGRASAVMGLHRAPDGRVFIVHSDQKLRIQGRLITGVSYLSVLGADRTRACVDGRLDVTQDAQPVFTFAGDTLFVVEQRMHEGGVRTTLSGYLIDTSKCTWLEVEPYVPTS
jgi:hypothetical protein